MLIYFYIKLIKKISKSKNDSYLETERVRRCDWPAGRVPVPPAVSVCRHEQSLQA